MTKTSSFYRALRMPETTKPFQSTANRVCAFLAAWIRCPETDPLLHWMRFAGAESFAAGTGVGQDFGKVEGLAMG
jgi:hypothetical protein